MLQRNRQIDRLSQGVRGRVRGYVASSVPLSLAYLRLARAMATAGINPPLSGRSEDQEFRWQNQGKPGFADSPDTYLEGGDKGDQIFSEVLPLLSEDARILEIGCNAGRSLDYLYRQGYRDLWGIEIGEKAVERFCEVFPETRSSTNLICGNAVDEIRHLPDNHFDFVFTRGVLVNIHPKHNSLFADMCRICRGHILTVENEGSWTAWPRDFVRMYEPHGFVAISERHEAVDSPLSEAFDPSARDRILRAPTIRLFGRSNSDAFRSMGSLEGE